MCVNCVFTSHLDLLPGTFPTRWGGRSYVIADCDRHSVVAPSQGHALGFHRALIGWVQPFLRLSNFIEFVLGFRTYAEKM